MTANPRLDGQDEPDVVEARFPEALPGHWDTPEGAEMATGYVNLKRGEFGDTDLSDFALANRQFMAARTDLDLVHWQTAAKERIRWLSTQLAALSAKPSPTPVDREGGGDDMWPPNTPMHNMALTLARIFDEQEQADGRIGGAETAYRCAVGGTVEFWNKMALAALQSTEKPVQGDRGEMARATYAPQGLEYASVDQNDVWLLKFADPDCRDQWFGGEGYTAEETRALAIDAWNRYASAWSVRLMRTVKLAEVRGDALTTDAAHIASLQAKVDEAFEEAAKLAEFGTCDAPTCSLCREARRIAAAIRARSLLTPEQGR